MTHTPLAPTLFEATHLACGKEHQQLFHMVSFAAGCALHVATDQCADPCTCTSGLWLNIPDYDAPTQMVKPKERNERYVDAVLTIPKVQYSSNMFWTLQLPSSCL